MSAFDEELKANAEYAASFSDPDMPGRAGKGLALVTCMDSRLDPLAVLGLSRGDAKVLRNPGGQVTDEVLKALVLSVHLLGVDRVLIAQHTDCRMTKVTEQQAHAAILEAGGVDTRSLDFGTIADQKAAVARDVERVKASPYLPRDLVVAGGVIDVKTGRLEILLEQ